MKRTNSSAQVVFMGLLFALAAALSALESALPAFFPVPGIKLGLSNIVVMYCIFLLGTPRAFLLAALKSLFALFTRGFAAALLSACGGAASILVMLLLLRVSARGAADATLVSVAGAVSHNLAQLALAALLLGTGSFIFYYAPVLIAAGILVGTLTAALLRMLVPCLCGKRMDGILSCQTSNFDK